MAAVVVALLTGLFALSGCGAPAITVVTTKSTVDSGLPATLIPTFEKGYGVKVEVVSAATCDEALKKAEAGDADVMYSDYVLLGPPSDPAGVKTFDCPAKSSKKIATMGITYVSRSDGSDLYKKELGYWNKNGYGDPTGKTWYIKTGKGMAETLKIADEKQGYVLTDMETYLKMKDQLSIVPIVQGCTMLFNRYAAMVVNPEQQSDNDKSAENAEQFVSFLTSRSGQAAIGSYKKYGVVLFHPSADASSGNSTI